MSHTPDFSDVGSGILNDPTDQKPFRLNRKKVGFTYSCPVSYDENPISDISDISERFETFGECRWLIATENHENGKKHYHAWVAWNSNIDTRNVRAFDVKGVHPNILSPGKGWMNYCMKTENYSANFKCRKPVKLITPDLWWEKDVLEILKDEPDERTIHWYWSEEGCVGKTSFCKYLAVKHDACLLQGKGADVRNGAATWLKDKGYHPELVIFPIPASYNHEYLNYEAIEQVKDMFFYSGKYEGGQVIGACPHLFVFANEPPDVSKLKADRWRIVEIKRAEPLGGGTRTSRGLAPIEVEIE